MSQAWLGLPPGDSSWDYSEGWNGHDHQALSDAACGFPIALERADWVKAREHYNATRRLVLKYAERIARKHAVKP